MDQSKTFQGKLASYGVVNRELSTGESWMTFWCLFCFCTMTMYNSIRVTPVLTDLGTIFGFTLSSSAFIVSAFAVAGLIFAFPSAWIMRTFGIKSTLLVAAIVSIVGTVMGLLVSDPTLFLFSRALEGCAFGIASVVVPNVIPRIFTPDKMGLVSGIWSLWVTPGLVLGFVTTPILFTSFGYLSLWIVSLALEVICTVWLVCCVKLPAIPKNAIEMEQTSKKVTYKHVHWVSTLAIALSMFCWGIVYGAVNTFYPTYLQVVKDMPLAMSSIVPLILALVTAPFGIIFGIIAGKTRTRKWFLVIPYLVAAVLYATIGFAENSNSVEPWIFAIGIGICAGGIPMATYALVPILAEDPKKADYGMAVLAFSLQLANVLIGFFGGIVEALGFYMASLLVLVPFAILGAVIALVSVGDKKALAEQDQERMDDQVLLKEELA
ncbi:MFS transporter [Adlercreutzia sp. ZJ154]|uniref:MFS transporter n=1 Tax=Adlercreutzia sp. ZJ154 TaxID=2709790 RepID=UPI0013ED974D|nr:MFS transporter [Adlercreutzia sp. ZJ154]